MWSPPTGSSPPRARGPATSSAGMDQTGLVAEGRRGRVAPAPGEGTRRRSGRPRWARSARISTCPATSCRPPARTISGGSTPVARIAVIDRDCTPTAAMLQTDVAVPDVAVLERAITDRAGEDRVVVPRRPADRRGTPRQPPARQRGAHRRRVPGRWVAAVARADRAGHRRAREVRRRQPRGVRVGPVGRARPRRRRRRAGGRRARAREGGSIFDPSPEASHGGHAAGRRTATCPTRCGGSSPGRAAQVVDYQSRALAERYLDLVERVRGDATTPPTIGRSRARSPRPGSSSSPTRTSTRSPACT